MSILSAKNIRRRRADVRSLSIDGVKKSFTSFETTHVKIQKFHRPEIGFILL